MKDTYYRDGYRVLADGDYIVRCLGKGKYDPHVVLRATDGAVMGRYLARKAAIVRAQALGGNTVRMRNRTWGGRTPKGLTSLETRAAQNRELRNLTQAVGIEEERDRSKEREELSTAYPASAAALEDHEYTDEVKRLSDVISETEALADNRFATPKMKGYLRRFSLGPLRLEGRYGYSYPAHTYRRAHIEVAWQALPERDRIRRCRQHYVLATTLLDNDEAGLRPTHATTIRAIEDVLRRFPLNTEVTV